MRKREKKFYVYVLLGAFCLVLLACGVFFSVRSYNSKSGKRAQEKASAQIKEEKLTQLEEDDGNYCEDTIVLSNTSREQAEAMAEDLGAEVRLTEDGSFAVLYLKGEDTIKDVFQSEEYEAYLSGMQPDYYAYVSDTSASGKELVSTRPIYTPNDTEYGLQGYLDYIDLDETWTRSTGSGVTVAVIDTGIDTDHPEFAGRISGK